MVSFIGLHATDIKTPDDQKKGLEGLQKQRDSLIVEKDQMRKEYTIICQQAESIEKRRKDLSKILFEVEKTPNINEQIADINRVLERVTHLRNKIKYINLKNCFSTM